MARTGPVDVEAVFSLVEGLPGVMRDGGLVADLIAAFDSSLAPVFVALDGLDSYLDPALSPADFLPWLGGCLGVAVNERWPVDRQRDFLRRSGDLYARRGTARGLADAIELTVGVRPEIVENGATEWGPQPSGPLPGASTLELVVRFPAGAEVDEGIVERLIADVKPAHVPHRIERPARAARRRASTAATDAPPATDGADEASE